MDWMEILKTSLAKQKEILASLEDQKRGFSVEEKTLFDSLAQKIEEAKAVLVANKAVGDVEDVLNTPQASAPKISIKNEKRWPSGLGEFLQAVRGHSISGKIDPRLVSNAAGANETVSAEGGFAVGEDLMQSLLFTTYEVAAVASRCTESVISSNANRKCAIQLDETSRAAGSRFGGIQGYWVPEAGTITSSFPKLRKVETKLNKLAGLFHATDELMEDAVALTSEVENFFPMEFAWLLDDAIINGDGAGKPLGLLNSAATVSVAKESGQVAATIVYQNIQKMWARMWAPSRANAVWFINQDCEPELNSMGMILGATGIPVYLPPGGLSSTPYATLMGRPVIPVEQCKTVGTTGDIWLADMSQYELVKKGSIKMDTSIHVNFVSDQMAFRFIMRVGGQPRWASTLTPANGTNTLSPFVKLDTRS